MKIVKINNSCNFVQKCNLRKKKKIKSKNTKQKSRNIIIKQYKIFCSYTCSYETEYFSSLNNTHKMCIKKKKMKNTTHNL